MMQKPQTGQAAEKPTPWHAHDAANVLAQLDALPAGLDAGEARRRYELHGPNRLPEPPRPGPLQRFGRQLNNVLIYVLLSAAVVTAIMGHWVDASVIMAVILVNTIIGFVQEGKAESALDAIRKMLSLTANVLRAGQRHEVPAEDLVPGDIVLLVSGDKVPADLRLIEARSLRIDEAALTGESVAVEKNTAAAAPDAAIGDRTGMAYSGTLVTYGQGRGVVTATGSRTEIGRISELIAQVEEISTPLMRRMTVFGRWLTVAILASAAATFAFGTWFRDYSLNDMFMAAVSLAVAAIPEGLPAIMTVTLAIGVQRMAKRHAIIRRLPAVETLGSVTVICSDKTGTLTRNEMTAQTVVTAEHEYTVSGVGYAPDGGFTEGGRVVLAEQDPGLLAIARAALLCNDAQLLEQDGQWQLRGDPTEGALLALALKAGLAFETEHDTAPRADAIPFESEHRFMATLHHDHAGGATSWVKGAPERLLEMCALEQRGNEQQAINVAQWHRRVDALAAEGKRVLALAVRRFDTPPPELRFSDVEQGLVLLGLVGMIDPPREEAVKAVAQCQQAGIRVIMITGDHAATAAAVGRQLGIGGAGRALTGADVERLDDAQLCDLVRGAEIFARASPEHKLRLVEALQRNGEIVAMTGDGVNDAPALKRADVGVAMGNKGTEAAKDASEIVLSDDNFASIAHAVEEGRTVYDNLKKAITFMLPINGGESLTVVAAIVAGVLLPITPVQILWVNMVSSVALGLTLAFEPTERDVMRRPPHRPNEPLLSAFLVWRVIFVSTLFLAGIFGMFNWALQRGFSPEEARTMAVNTLVAMEVFYLFSVRYLRTPSFTLTGVKGTPPVLIAVFLVFGLQLAFTYAPFMHTLFSSRPIAFGDGVLIVLTGVAVLVILEVEKWLLRRLGFSAGRSARLSGPGT